MKDTIEREWDEDEGEYIDIDATIEAVRAAWKCVPDVNLSELLDLVTTMPFVELSNAELIEELNQFIHQNSRK